MQVPDDKQELMHEYVPRAILEKFRGSPVWVQEISFHDIPHRRINVNTKPKEGKL